MLEALDQLLTPIGLEWSFLILAVVIAAWFAHRITRRIRVQRRALSDKALGGELAGSRWYALEIEKIYDLLDAALGGLASEEAARRLAQHGPNRLPEAKRRPALIRFFNQFNNILIYVLLLAAVITTALGHWIDSGVIVGVVMINALIGFIQEGKAEDAMESIRNLLTPPRAVVLRDGRQLTISAEQLVPGDVVVLQSGDKVPVDIRLFQVKNLQAQEAALTGESIPVSNSTEVLPAGIPIGDRKNMAFAGTLITAGRGMGIVVATGASTELGCINSLLAGLKHCRRHCCSRSGASLKR